MDDTSVILIVDDEPLERQLLEILLAGPGYRLSFAGDGVEALEQAARLTPDLILLDVMIPGLDGFQVCQRLRADPLLAQVPIIMVTALVNREARLRGIEVGADDFITKPFDPIELRARVHMITRLNRYRRWLVEQARRQQAEEEIRRRDLEIALLNYAVATATSTRDEREVLRIGCDVLSHIFDMPQAIALTLDETRLQFDAALEWPCAPAASQEPGRGWRVTGGIAPLAKDPVAQYLFERRVPLAAADAQADPGLAHLHHAISARGIASILVLPLVARERVAGVIELSAVRRRDFDDQDLALAQNIAAAFGQALETAQLYQKLQRHANDLEATVARRTLELQVERDRTQAILEAVGEAVVVTDVEGNIRYVNPAAVELTGLAAQEAVGQTWRVWQTESWSPELYAQIQARLRAGQTWRGEAVNKRKDGSLYNAAMTIAPLFDPHAPGQTMGLVSVQRDITPLREAERLKDQFVSNVSHELRTPLSVITLISGNLEALYERLDDTRRRKMIHDIRGHTRVLNDLIERVLEISRIDSLRVPMERRPINLAQLVREEANKQLPLARKKSHTLRVSGAEQLMVLGNDGQLRQVFRNLLNNAIKYTPEGGQITCECRARDAQVEGAPWPGSADLGGDWAAVRIADTGMGIGAQDLPHVFERFFRVETQGNVPGTGLGLSIARELVELHNGHIAAASTPGAGSVFAVYLPLVEEKQT